MGCKRYDGCIRSLCVLFQMSWQLQTQIVKNKILSDSLLGNKLYSVTSGSLFSNKKKNSDEQEKESIIRVRVG